MGSEIITREEFLEKYLKEVRDKATDYWCKPGQVQSLMHCLQIGGPKYNSRLISIARDMIKDCSEEDDMEDVLLNAQISLISYYYINSCDAEKLAALLAKEAGCYIYKPTKKEPEMVAETGINNAADEEEITVLGGLHDDDRWERILSNSANEEPDDIDGRVSSRQNRSKMKLFSDKELEEKDLEELDISKRATCDLMRNGFIFVGDYINPDDDKVSAKSKIQDDTVAEFFNKLVRYRYHGLDDSQFNSYGKGDAEGKKKCNILREIRRSVAEANEIPYYSEDCTFEGACPGTCPKCDEEIKYLQRKLDERKASGKEIVITKIEPSILSKGFRNYGYYFDREQVERDEFFRFR